MARRFAGWSDYEFRGLEEWEEWAEWEEEAMLRYATPYSQWRWPLDPGRLPLDDLLSGPATIRVLREIWHEPETSWPATIARRARLSRTTVHAILKRLTRARVIQPVRAWDSNRTLGCRLNDDHPLVPELRRLYNLEERIWGRRRRGPARPWP